MAGYLNKSKLLAKKMEKSLTQGDRLKKVREVAEAIPGISLSKDGKSMTIRGQKIPIK